jgi:hypothetical protein
MEGTPGPDLDVGSRLSEQLINPMLSGSDPELVLPKRDMSDAWKLAITSSGSSRDRQRGCSPPLPDLHRRQACLPATKPHANSCPRGS